MDLESSLGSVSQTNDDGIILLNHCLAYRIQNSKKSANSQDDAFSTTSFSVDQLIYVLIGHFSRPFR